MSIRYLGLYIDENLSWHRHVECILQRVLSRVHCLYRLHPLPDNLLGRLYRTFILPLIDYCDTVWMPSSMLHFKHLERLHSRFCTNNAETFLWVSLTEHRRYNVAVQVYRVLHKLSPSYLFDTFRYAVDVTSHIGRNPLHLFILRVRTKCIVCTGALLKSSIIILNAVFPFKKINVYLIDY